MEVLSTIKVLSLEQATVVPYLTYRLAMDGMEVIRELVSIVELHGLEAEVLTASVRHPRHVTEAALAGSHIATLPFKVLQQMIHHPLTDKGILQFRHDWEKARAEAAAKR